MPTRLSITIALLLISTPAPARDQPGTGRAPRTGADVKIVLVPVTVTDRQGATVTGLGRDRFTLLQDNVPQKILSFSREDMPCSIGILVDAGRDKDPQLDAAKLAIKAFLQAAEGTDERFSLTLVDRAMPRSGVIRPTGEAALLDTLYATLSHMRSAHHRRRALLLLSAGVDNHSRYSTAELLRAAIESDVQMHAISIGKAAQTAHQGHGQSLLEELCEQTGGLHFLVTSKTDIKKAASAIGLALRSQYLLAYRPRDVQQPGKWHTIRIKVDAPKANVYARNGYYAQ